MQQVTIIVPVKDEEVGLQYLIENIGSSKIEEEFEIDFIFVIDDRTSDNSRQIATRLSKRIIDQSETYGKGAAIKQAVNQWILNQSYFVIFLDADGSYSFNGVREIISALKTGADVASGSRFIGKNVRPKGMGRIHIFGNRFLSKISSIRNGRQISDLCTGLWGFTGEALKKIEIKSNGFDLEAELAGEVRKRKLLHLEVPIKWSQRKGGISKLRSIRDGLIILARIIRT